MNNTLAEFARIQSTLNSGESSYDVLANPATMFWRIQLRCFGESSYDVLTNPATIRGAFCPAARLITPLLSFFYDTVDLSHVQEPYQSRKRHEEHGTNWLPAQKHER